MDLLERLRDPRALRPSPEELIIEIEHLRAQARIRIWIIFFTAAMSFLLGSALTSLAFNWTTRDATAITTPSASSGPPL
jgi:hypothetical protein